MVWNAVVEEPQAVVFVSDRSGAALRRRERCLKLAGIPHGIEAERRPSGTYYKLLVREQDAVAAHLAGRSSCKNRRPPWGPRFGTSRGPFGTRSVSSLARSWTSSGK
jgi:hypothetical protein